MRTTRQVPCPPIEHVPPGERVGHRQHPGIREGRHGVGPADRPDQPLQLRRLALALRQQIGDALGGILALLDLSVMLHPVDESRYRLLGVGPRRERLGQLHRLSLLHP
jgi:hypothetical protein